MTNGRKLKNRRYTDDSVGDRLREKTERIRSEVSKRKQEKTINCIKTQCIN